MDLDAYVAAHHHQWARLEELVGRRRLTGVEADELLDLYQRVSTHLSVVRSASPDPSVVAHLSSLIARARLATAGRRTGTWLALRHFFVATFPAGLYRLRWWWVSTALVNVAVAVAVRRKIVLASGPISRILFCALRRFGDHFSRVRLATNQSSFAPALARTRVG